MRAALSRVDPHSRYILRTVKTMESWIDGVGNEVVVGGVLSVVAALLATCLLSARSRCVYICGK